MKTISAKELRDNLGEYIKRTQRGEAIKVTFRSKPAFRLEPERGDNELVPGSKEAMQEFVSEVRQMNKIPRKSTLDPNKSIKELYHELLDSDPKYNRA